MMARPEEVDHGRFHGQLVRVYPERVDTAEYRAYVEHFTQKPCTETDEEIIASCVAHARKDKHGAFESGQVAKCVMVSRMGDCGITKHLDADHGYCLRVGPECLEIIPEEEARSIMADWRTRKIYPTLSRRRV